jgi:hypothetical protein
MTFHGKNKTPKVYRPEGELRQSQLVTTFGPGSMVDLVDRAVVIGGLEHWSWGSERRVSLDDPRLRRSLIPRLKALDPDLDLAPEGYFLMPPAGEGREASPSVGIRALEFPKWFVCQGCHRLWRPTDKELKKGRYRHQCASNKEASAVPVRFVHACKAGHLSEFPWVHFAHHQEKDSRCDAPELFLKEDSLGDISRIDVECRTCHAHASMSEATVLKYRCNGERPWLGGRDMNEPCDQHTELLVRNASHAYFSQVVSALRLPEPEPDPIRRRVREPELWEVLQKVKSQPELELLVGLVPKVANGLREYLADASKVVDAIQAERDAATGVQERPLRSAEYDRLISSPWELPGSVPETGAQFAAYRVKPEALKLPYGVQGLVVVPALREVRVQVSFSRFDSISANLQGEYDFVGKQVKPAVLTLPNGNQKWLPAAEVRGEGVFLQLDLEAVRKWETRIEVINRTKQLQQAFDAEGRGEFPGARFYLLHSLSHLLLTAISLECGYAASAIRERIYCGLAEDEGPDMAGIMLTTGTTGSEGTLGGLVEEGRRIRHHLREAWDLGRLCSNDPVCAAHDPSSPSSDRHTEGAACHGCLYIAECSCERFNKFLDRALVVPTIGNAPELAFFMERP